MKGLEYIARALALLWAAFWTLFFIVESLAWRTPLSQMAIWVGVGLAFVVAALIAWRWEVTGGVVLIAAGVLSAMSYGIFGPRALSVATRVMTLITFGVPPVAAGALFLMHHRRVTHT